MQEPAPVSTPSVTSKWRQMIARMPRPDPEEKILQGVEEGQVEKVVAELLAGGAEAVHALVDMLAEPGAGEGDSPVRHALHALVMHTGGLPARERWPVAVALATALADADRPDDVKRFIIRQLQLCGTASVAGALGECLRDDTLYQDAAMALLAVRAGAAEQFRSALADVAGPQRVAVIQALGTLKDAEAAPALRRTAERDADPVARLEAVLALARLGDAASADVVLRAADDATGFDRVRATDACLLLAENLASAGNQEDSKRIYQHLRDTRSDPSEHYVRRAAERALGAPHR